MRDFITSCIPLAVAIIFIVLIGVLVRYFFKWKKEDEVSSKIKKALIAKLKDLESKPQNNFTIVQSEHVEWTVSDVSALRQFFANETGQKVVKICGAHIVVESMRECSGDTGSPRAYGMDSMLKFIYNLASDAMVAKISPPPATQEDNTADAQGEQGEPVDIRRAF